jgi:hypothetical protein
LGIFLITKKTRYKPDVIDGYIFHNALYEYCPKEKRNPFGKQRRNRYFLGRDDFELIKIVEELGPTSSWPAEFFEEYVEIKDFSPNSYFLLPFWVEDAQSEDVVCWFSGQINLDPITYSEQLNSFAGSEFYAPNVLLSAFAAILHEKQLERLVKACTVAIQNEWQRRKDQAIFNLSLSREWRERFLKSFDSIASFSITAPVIDRDLTIALYNLGYRITGTLHVITSTTQEYDFALIRDHVSKIQKMKQIIETFEKQQNSNK